MAHQIKVGPFYVDSYVDYEGLRKFSDNLKMYFDGWQDMSEYDRNALISFYGK